MRCNFTKWYKQKKNACDADVFPKGPCCDAEVHVHSSARQVQGILIYADSQLQSIDASQDASIYLYPSVAHVYI